MSGAFKHLPGAPAPVYWVVWASPITGTSGVSPWGRGSVESSGPRVLATCAARPPTACVRVDTFPL
eukprot:11203269-Lingulodinium_polyedra.AAC.1